MQSFRLSTSSRGQFWLAVIPLACLAISRGLLEIEHAIDSRLSDLAALDARIAEGRVALGRVLSEAPSPAHTPSAAPAGPAGEGPHVDEWAGVSEFTRQCFDCDRPAVALTASGVPVCPDHDPTVRLA